MSMLMVKIIIPLVADIILTQIRRIGSIIFVFQRVNYKTSASLVLLSGKGNKVDGINSVMNNELLLIAF